MKRLLTQGLLLKGLVFAIACVGAMHVPLLGLLFALLATPLMLAWPGMSTTGRHVEIGFAWIQIQSLTAWVTFIVYFFLLFVGVALVFRYLRQR